MHACTLLIYRVYACMYVCMYAMHVHVLARPPVHTHVLPTTHGRRYLFKFFLWEMGYMRSIDIIVDRAGFQIQWGCLVWVPAVYTLHSRYLVQYPSGFSFAMAAGLFILSMAGVVLNYLADLERDVFRASGGKAKVWGREPRFIEAEYEVVDRKTGERTRRTVSYTHLTLPTIYSV